MRLPKIDVVFIPDSFRYSAHMYPYNFNPVLLISGCLVEDDLKPTDGSIRAKYVGDDFIVKIDCELEQSRCEVRLWNRVKGTPDAKYFVPILRHGYDKRAKRGWVVVPKRNLRHRRPNKAQRDIISRLIRKYNLGLDMNARDVRNWAIDADTNQPVIYDYGVS